MKTYMAKKGEIAKEWYVVDAANKPLGRLASRIAAILRGKHKPVFTPHVDTGDYVVVINADKVKFTGNKIFQMQKKYYTGFRSGLRLTTYDKVMEKEPTYAITHAVKGMLPKNKLGRQIFKKLKVYAGSDHPHKAQQPKELEL